MLDNLLLSNLRRVINNSFQLLDLKPEDFEVLNRNAETLQEWAEEIVRSFYDKLYSNEDALKILEGIPRQSLEKTLKGWYLSLLSGKPDEDFWISQWLVGLVHIAKGVSNDYMLSMMSHIQLKFGELCFQEFDDIKAWQIFKAFKKITDIIGVLIVEGYIELYKKAIEGMSGIKPALIDRMAFLESQRMWEEHKRTL